MKQMSIIISSILALVVISQTCNYGEFEEVNGECKFNCEYQDNYISIDSVPFDTIKHSCHRVGPANKAFPSLCNSVNDLVWMNDSCSCPLCKCPNTTSKTFEEAGYDIFGPNKYCYEVKCEQSLHFGAERGIKDMVFTYDHVNFADNPMDWEFYATCPPKQCTYSSYGGNIRTVKYGDYWWKDNNESDTLCTEFCYCTSNGDTACEKGWDDIMDNDELKNAFIRDCGGYHDSGACYNVETRSYDTNRLFTTDSGPGCSSCPKCDCGSYKFNDTWHVEYQDYYGIKYNEAVCAKCTCKKDNNDNLYADCEETGSSYGVGEKICNVNNGTGDETNYYSCHSDLSNSGTVSTLSPSTCSSSSDYDFEYCEWGYSIDQEDYYWGCGREMLCEAFADEYCTYINVPSEDSDEYTIHYLQCCDGSDCNYNISNVDTETCSRSIAYENIYIDHQNCSEAVSSNIYDSYVGFYYYDDTEEITCDGLTSIFTQIAECDCEYYSGIFSYIKSTASQIVFTKNVDDEMKKYSHWNYVLGCDIDISCDLSSGIVTNNGSSPSELDTTTTTMTSISTSLTMDDLEASGNIIQLYLFHAIILLNFIIIFEMI